MAEDHGRAESPARSAKACSRTGSGNREAEVTLKTRARTTHKSGCICFGGGPGKTKGTLVRRQASGHRVAYVLIQTNALVERIPGSVDMFEKFDEDHAS